jgi:Di-haem oxidoreductase, putative peroxidase
MILAARITSGVLCLLATSAFAQHDPGVRGGINNTAGFLQFRGIPIPHPPLLSPHPTTGATVNPNEKVSFFEGINRAGQLESTCDTCSDVTQGSPVVGLGELDPVFPQFHTNSNGLGARHNADQCFGKKNVVPPFEQQFGPIREVRFKFHPDGTRDGGVHQLWVVTGINNDPTIPNCSIVQPDFESQLRAGNLSFRIPLQMTGLGLIDSIQDQEILSHFNATASQRAALAISGHPNRSGNDGTITRFGWKAQNKSLTMFAAEAYNVEMGITNELFPTATEEDPNCNGPKKPAPNDVTRTDPNDAINEAFNNPRHILADWMQFTLLMRFTDAPQPDPNPSLSAQRGRTVFSAIGCALCHTPQMQTAPAMNSPVLQDRPVNLFSDLLVHHMGAGLADDIRRRAGRIPHHAALGRRPAAVLPP